jgi:hypothetical protein
VPHTGHTSASAAWRAWQCGQVISIGRPRGLAQSRDAWRQLRDRRLLVRGTQASMHASGRAVKRKACQVALWHDSGWQRPGVKRVPPRVAGRKRSDAR